MKTTAGRVDVTRQNVIANKKIMVMSLQNSLPTLLEELPGLSDYLKKGPVVLTWYRGGWSLLQYDFTVLAGTAA
jgi:hypothetical protein